MAKRMALTVVKILFAQIVMKKEGFDMTIQLSCGHVTEDGCLGVPVEFQDEQCVAGEGFVPCTVEAVYCHKCAMDLAAAEERTKIVAWLRGKAILNGTMAAGGQSMRAAYLYNAKKKPAPAQPWEKRND